MKHRLDESGKPYFDPSEWKTSAQIKSFFSRHSSKNKQLKAAGALTTEDVEAWEAEEARNLLRDEIQSNLQPQQHPILVGQVNICEYVSKGLLVDLKLLELKDLCKALSLVVEGSKAKKKSFIDALIKRVQICSCNS